MRALFSSFRAFLPRLKPEQAAEFYAQRVRRHFQNYQVLLVSAAALTLAFSAWDMYVDPSSFQVNLSLRLAGTVAIIAYFKRLSQARSALELDRHLVAFVCLYSTYLCLLLSHVRNGLTLGMGSFTLLLTLASITFAHTRRVPFLTLALIPVGISLGRSPLSQVEAVSHLLILSMSLMAGWLTSLMLEASARRQFILEQQLKLAASTDSLTGLLNRRAVLAVLDNEVVRSQRYNRQLSAIMIDIDHFKLVNDRYGHQAGDQVLISLAHACEASLRSSDLFARWGGEEFLIILPETGLNEALVLAERLRSKIEALLTPTESGKLSFTISLGVTQLKEQQSWQTLCDNADKALYAAKRSGRNRVCAEG